MADVILDETEWVDAILADTDRGDLEAARLATCIQLKHRWVITSAIAAKYRAHYKRRIGRNRNPIALEMIRSLSEVLYDSTKSLQTNEDLRVIEGEYHKKDQHIVSAAAWARESVVVTSDARLTNQLRKAQIPAKHGFSLLSRAEANLELCQDR